MLLPDFPIEFWSIRIFEAVAKSVGKFIFFDELSLRWSNKRLAWVLVELDLDRGLPDVIDISIGDTHIRQSVDFWREPFPLPFLLENEVTLKRCVQSPGSADLTWTTHDRFRPR
jgi:hypothetical protein